MSHIHYIANKKLALDARWNILRQIREFFWSQNFQEVETPLLTPYGGQEPYLSPMSILLHDELGKIYNGYLHTSPEYTMKKMLAAGYERIFSLCKTFRDYESFGGSHNPEFTMLEWYRSNANMFSLMDDIADLLLSLGYKHKLTRITMSGLWKDVLNLSLESYLSKESLYDLCIKKGYNVAKDESYEDLFYRIMLNEIEPKLVDMGAVIISHYPAQMAALASFCKEDNRFAERFELYINGLEIANAFSELTDGGEQIKRFEAEQKKRKELGKQVFPIDKHFIEAVYNLPESAGIALGVDRLVQVITDCQNIDDVVVLGAKEMFKQ